MTVLERRNGRIAIIHPTAVKQSDEAIVEESARNDGLWIGGNHLLGREEVAALVKHLVNWLGTDNLGGR